MGQLAAVLLATSLLGSFPARRGSLARMSGARPQRRMAISEIIERLDALPCLVVVDGHRHLPSLKDDAASRTQLHLSVASATRDLDAARKRNPGLQLSLQPVGLGLALAQPEGVVVVPSDADLLRARDLPGGDEIEWDPLATPVPVPLFGCYALKRVAEDGTVVTPLFLACDDAEAAIAEAQATARANGESTELELRSTTLESMLQMMSTGQVSDPYAISFVPPRRLREFLATIEPLEAVVSTEDELLQDPKIAGQILAAQLDSDRRSPTVHQAGLFPE